MECILLAIFCSERPKVYKEKNIRTPKQEISIKICCTLQQIYVRESVNSPERQWRYSHNLFPSSTFDIGTESAYFSIRTYGIHCTIMGQMVKLIFYLLYTH